MKKLTDSINYVCWKIYNTEQKASGVAVICVLAFTFILCTKRFTHLGVGDQVSSTVTDMLLVGRRGGVVD